MKNGSLLQQQDNNFNAKCTTTIVMGLGVPRASVGEYALDRRDTKGFMRAPIILIAVGAVHAGPTSTL